MCPADNIFHVIIKRKRGEKMKSLKDFIYDKNDIIIALVILILAALLIVWRMDAIMEYPQTLAQQTGTTDTTDETAVPSEDDSKGGDSGLWSKGVLSKEIKVKVAGGSATAAVQSLVDAGLFSSYEEFTKVCKAAGYTPEDIKATTFTFEAGCTQTDIAKKVTKYKFLS